MNQECSDQSLAQLFERQRDLDRGATPSFARLSKAAQPAPRRLRRPTWAAMLAVVAVPALAVSVFQLHLHDLASNAPTPTRDTPISIATWQSPTDSLLQNFGGAPLASLTALGGSWTDELLPSPPASANQ